MPANHYLKILNQAGEEELRINGQGVRPQFYNPDENLSGFYNLDYSKIVNQMGLLKFTIDGDHPLVSLLQPGWQVEVWRSNFDFGIGWYRDFAGLYLSQTQVGRGRSPSLFTAICPDAYYWLKVPIIAYKAETANRTLFQSVATETIMKTLVQYNATSSGTTADGREYDVPSFGTYISIETDAAGGEVRDEYKASQTSLLTHLQRLAHFDDSYFYLEKNGDQSWIFNYYNNQIGADRSTGDDAVTFSIDHGNMRNPTYKDNALSEPTRILVGGQLDKSDRIFGTATGANYDGYMRSQEIFLAANNYSDVSALNDLGSETLEQRRSKESIDFEVLQVESSAYGLHYGWADKVLTRFVTDLVQMVYKVTVRVNSQNSSNPESIDVDLVNV